MKDMLALKARVEIKDSEFDAIFRSKNAVSPSSHVPQLTTQSISGLKIFEQYSAEVPGNAKSAMRLKANKNVSNLSSGRRNNCKQDG